ncbi:brefeldin A-inhibited guanine nucleotide-exchange protein 1-like [Amphibalanus amphitrite]|uniref:brefeldin A-inhibited guanine nucleotide-exchange protein 1-like n=1 Tax=Amphibalanus amphitrite TaxID=1232801 RepID=UPI001C919216|nr:brefeldin A-inhibited guanine nucleotide-exchange protein 1-like [Amphibalanus amphitrite]
MSFIFVYNKAFNVQKHSQPSADSERDWTEEPAPATPGTLSTRGSELSLSDHTPEAYESLKQIKDTWEQGIDMFNRKPKRGLAFLQRQGLLKDTPDSIAAFFHEDHRLDRTVLGDFLGEPDQQQVSSRRGQGARASGWSAAGEARGPDQQQVMEAWSRYSA